MLISSISIHNLASCASRVTLHNCDLKVASSQPYLVHSFSTILGGDACLVFLVQVGLRRTEWRPGVDVASGCVYVRGVAWLY